MHVPRYRVWLYTFLACIGMLMPALPVDAGTPTYAGNLQVMNGASLTYANGASGCLLAVSGVVTVMPCPVGTVAFSASSPFTVTGSGPYVIGCPTCYTTAGGTITGAVTLSSTLAVTGAVTLSAGLTTPGLVTVNNTYGSTDALKFKSGTSSTYTSITSGTATVNGVAGTLLALTNTGTTDLINFDASGNVGTLGTVTATNFFSSSKRSHKQDIQPLSFDALQVLRDTDWASFRYLPKWGDPKQTHIGFIADDTPSVLSGPLHDHFDAQALATVDAQAILQLERDVQVLWICCALLAVLLVIVLGVALMKREA